MRIVFMGTPEFARYQLEYLITQGFDVAAVVTMPDKPMGRGMKLGQSPVKEYAVANSIPVLQPEKLKDPLFIEALKKINADIFVVIAFRMLPEVVWSMPQYGTVNLHASLLPQYRGAAPINWAIINGEKETGVTTFFIQQEIDTGNILLQKKVEITPQETAGTLHDKLMITGARVVADTLTGIKAGTLKGRPQQQFNVSGLRPAPKIFREHCEINWKDTAQQIYDLVRGLSPHPVAHTWVSLKNGSRQMLKIYAATVTQNDQAKEGIIYSDNRTKLEIGTSLQAISVKELQLEGKKRMDIKTFLAGFDVDTVVKVG